MGVHDPWWGCALEVHSGNLSLVIHEKYQMPLVIIVKGVGGHLKHTPVDLLGISLHPVKFLSGIGVVVGVWHFVL